MTTFATLLPLLKITLVFVSMLGGIRMRLGLGVSIILGGALTGVLFGLPITEWGKTALYGIFNEKTLFLMAIVGFIMVLSNLLEKTGQSARLMDALSAYLHNPHLRLMFFPALIGLLPMPGGAVFSAPMVEGATRGMGLTAEDKTLVNYWFRHIWELSWPLYPGFILAASLSGLPITEIALYACPGMVITFLLGWWFILRPVVGHAENLNPERQSSVQKHPARVLREGLPLLTAICGAIGFEVVLSIFAPEVPFEYGIISALFAAIVCSVVQNGFPTAPIKEALVGKHLWSMLWVVIAIFVFKQFLTDAGVVTELSKLATGQAALIVVAIALPFLVGFISGITMAYVGSTFPIMLGMLAELGMGDHVMQYTVLGLFSGFTGIMVSPIHICFLLTGRYFEADLAKCWRKIVAPSFLLLASGIVWFTILSY